MSGSGSKRYFPSPPLTWTKTAPTMGGRHEKDRKQICPGGLLYIYNTYIYISLLIIYIYNKRFTFQWYHISLENSIWVIQVYIYYTYIYNIYLDVSARETPASSTSVMSRRSCLPFDHGVSVRFCSQGPDHRWSGDSWGWVSTMLAWKIVL